MFCKSYFSGVQQNSAPHYLKLLRVGRQLQGQPHLALKSELRTGLQAVFSSVGCKCKKKLRFESSQFEALNEVYL